MRPTALGLAIAFVASVSLVSMPVQASGITMYVAAALNSTDYLLVSQSGKALLVRTDETWQSCYLMAKSIGSTIDVVQQTSQLLFPGSTRTCLVARSFGLNNGFRKTSTGSAIDAVYLAGMDGINPILITDAGTATVATLTPGCVPYLRASIGKFVFTGRNPTDFTDTNKHLYLFGAGTSCIISGESSAPASVSAPTTYAGVLSEYEDSSWPLNKSGFPIPPVFTSDASPQPSSTPAAPRSTPKSTSSTSIPAGTGGGTFSDVPAAHFAAPYVAALLKAGVLQNADKFHPDAPITRAEYAKLIVIARRQELKTPPWPAWFIDVSASSTLAPYIYTIASRSWASGQDGRFHPDAPISRLEAVIILQRAFALPPDPSTTFSDVAGKDSAGPSAAQKAGIVKGVGGHFEPSRSITRAEAAKVIALALRRK